MVMSICEQGPNDGTYEWRHAVTNRYAKESIPNPSSLSQFAAKERFLFFVFCCILFVFVCCLCFCFLM